MTDLPTLRAATVHAADPKLYGAESVRAELAYRAHATRPRSWSSWTRSSGCARRAGARAG